MGNSQSNDAPAPAPAPASTIQPTPHPPKAHLLRRKEQDGSSQSHASKAAAPPTATLVSTRNASTSRTRTHAHATLTPSPASSHSRARSTTTSAPTPPHPRRSASNRKPDSSSMGNQESRQQRPPSPSQLPVADPSNPAREATPQPSPSTRPVDVPHQAHTPSEDRSMPSDPPAGESPYGLAPRNYSRPPRLPIPIEEEVHTPGSPIISPQDVSSPIDANEVDGVLPRRTSVLSSTTVDDDDVVDNDAFLAEHSQSTAPTIPTNVEWKGPGEKVYVTGTFVQWERKFKLHREKDRDGFSATVQLKPGTHHVKFLVDGDMMTSNNLPTTVDYTNILVNYIEVVAPLPSEAVAQPPAPAEPMPIPGAAITAGQTTGTGEPAARPLDMRIQARAPETDADLASTLLNTVASEENSPYAGEAHLPRPTSSPTKPLSKKKVPRPKYTKDIPAFLLDLDNYTNPEDPRFQRASRVMNQLPQPPSLPMFLGKSILNGATPHKDDASVLIMPNHTVLNHLATSSIKHGVLATSGTTRYKRKFLTTIMYKPTSNDA